MATHELALPIDLLGSLRPLVASRHDPTIRLRHDRFARASRTPDGPATLEVHAVGERRFRASATGPGRDWALAQVASLLGADDDLDGFTPEAHPTVARAHRRRPGLRIIRSGRIEDLLVPTILAQRVTAREAGSAWTRMVTAWGEPAPGDLGLRLPPSPTQLAERPYWDYHHLGVERSRAQRIARACRHLAGRSLVASGDGGRTTYQWLLQVPGIGPWTAALVARTSAGDADAVEVGDFHVKNHVTYALTGQARGSDERMLELLAPFPGHRGRVVRLLTSVVRRPPAFGPRRRIVPVESL
jgi:3-methyladenine DNA glycosylase/8-oxoguanine DNA glycosylase